MNNIARDIWKVMFLVVLCTIILAACASSHGAAKEDTEVEGVGSIKANIVAGHGEPSFTENFGLDISLPIHEDKFRSLLDTRHIGYRLIDSTDGKSILPAPRHRKLIGPENYKKMYEIYGEIDTEHRIGKRFRAYVNSTGMVIYIENAFSYTGP